MAKIPTILILLFMLFGQRTVIGQIQSVMTGEKKAIFLTWQFSFGEIGNKPGQFKNPQAISIDPVGNLLICDTDNNRIQKFNGSGKYLKQIGGFGWEREQFYEPRDINARSTLDIFIADYQNHRIERYDRELNHISSLYSNPTWSEKLQFTLPVGIAFSRQRELFLLDEEERRVIKINSFGEPEMYFGDFDSGRGRLERPHQIEIAGDERIFISDTGAGVVRVYDYFGNFLESWGSGQLIQPTGIFWDDRGFLLVVDTEKKQLMIFEKYGGVLFPNAKLENLSIELNEPVDAVAFKNQIFLLDAAQSKVHVFEFKFGK